MKRRREDSSSRIELIPVCSLPEITQGTSLARELVTALRREGIALRDGDVVAVTQKIVSKAEGQIVDLRRVAPSPLARRWARRLRADPRQVEVILRETRRVVRLRGRVLIVETRHGFICANAGVDHSNVPGRHWVTCLPKDPDRSARRIAADIRKRLRVRVGAILTDTWGRPWREGQLNFAIGAAGLRVLRDLRGRRDAFGHRLRATVLATADELAAAAGLVMGKTRGVPVVVIRGFAGLVPGSAGRSAVPRATDSARRLLRPAAQDLFR